jgi:phospholipid/cholesterol/gamma-HCH transport system substrate-binding protein
MSFRDRNQVVVGVLGLVCVAAAVAAVFAIGTLGLFEDEYELSAVFRDTGGIEKGADVRVAGVTVGRVTGIHPDYDAGQVVISFTVEHGVELGEDTRAEITAATLLGGYYLRLSGSPEAPFLEDLPTADPRRRLPLEQTQGPASLIGTLSETTTAIQAVDLDAVNQVLRELAGATDRNAELLPTLIQSLSDIGTTLAGREDELRRLAANSEQVTEALARRDGELVALVDTATVLLDQLAARRDELAAVLGDGSGAVAQLTATIVEHRASLDAVLTDIHVLAGAIGDNIPVINESLGDAGTIFTLLGRTLADTGGFDVAVEGFVVSLDQYRSLIDLLLPDAEPEG